MNVQQVTEDFDMMEVRRFNQVNAWGDSRKAEPAKKPLGFNQLMRAACDATGIEPAVFQEKTRRRECIYARTLVSVYLQGHTTFSLRTVGELTGGRDHASALHDKKRYADLRFSKNADWKVIEECFVEKLKSFGRQYIDYMPDAEKLN